MPPVHKNTGDTYRGILSPERRSSPAISDSVEEAENVMKFMNETTAQWRNLSVEVRSVRSMLEEVLSNWDRYGNTVASLQAWLEDAEKMLSQSENAKKVRLFTRKEKACCRVVKERFLTAECTRSCQISASMTQEASLTRFTPRRVK